MPGLREKDSVPSARASAKAPRPPPSVNTSCLFLFFLELWLLSPLPISLHQPTRHRLRRNTVAPPLIMPPSSSPPPAQSIAIPVTPAPEAALPALQAPDKMQIVERIAAGFHKTHTYTLEGDFVCLDIGHRRLEPTENVWYRSENHGREH